MTGQERENAIAAESHMTGPLFGRAARDDVSRQFTFSSCNNECLAALSYAAVAALVGLML
jgi:hypothetical protein